MAARRNAMEFLNVPINLLCIILILAGLSGASKTKKESCKQPLDRLKCNILYDVIEREGMFSISKETLENNCTGLLDSFRCLRDHWKKCNPISMESLVMYMSGVKRIFEELCDSDSKLRKDYEREIPCLTASSAQLQRCIQTAEQKVRILMKNNPHLHFLSVSAYRCLAHIELVGCTRNVAQENCGPDTGQLIGELVERSIRPYRYLKCHLFEHLKQPSEKEEYTKALF